MTAGQVSLFVNDKPIVLDDFVQGYIGHVVSGVLASLKGTGEMKSVDLAITVLNDTAVSLNSFATRIIRNTLVGMISTLHGVQAIERTQLSIKK
jgi:hypothetical protein